MSNITIKNNENYFLPFIEQNRTKLDESLVSLRFMKEIDDFMDEHRMNQKDLAKDLNTSAAFVSQLMSGVKKINTSFINKFEKTYDVEFKVSLKKPEVGYFEYETTHASIKIEMHISGYMQTNEFFSIENNSDNYYKLEVPSIVQK